MGCVGVGFGFYGLELKVQELDQIQRRRRKWPFMLWRRALWTETEPKPRSPELLSFRVVVLMRFGVLGPEEELSGFASYAPGFPG